MEIDLTKYPFKASARTTLDPSKVDVSLFGDHSSVVKNRGERDYGFTTELGRDLFVETYKRAHSALPCWWGEI